MYPSCTVSQISDKCLLLQVHFYQLVGYSLCELRDFSFVQLPRHRDHRHTRMLILPCQCRACLAVYFPACAPGVPETNGVAGSSYTGAHDHLKPTVRFVEVGVSLLSYSDGCKPRAPAQEDTRRLQCGMGSHHSLAQLAAPLLCTILCPASVRPRALSGSCASSLMARCG